MRRDYWLGDAVVLLGGRRRQSHRPALGPRGRVRRQFPRFLRSNLSHNPVPVPHFQVQSGKVEEVESKFKVRLTYLERT